MEILNTIILIILVYLVLVFGVTRIIFPFMGFRFALPKKIPDAMWETIRVFESTSSSKEEYLQKAYDFVTSKWHAGRFVTIYKFPLAFRKDLTKIWNSSGYAHCTTQNYMLFVLLAGSKYFKQEDIKVKTVFFNFFIHQYLSINMGDRSVNADPGGAGIRGIPLGQNISFFG